MKKTIITVFIILGILVLALLIWAFVFNGGGLPAIMNGVIRPINTIYQNMTGGSDSLIPEWNQGSANDITEARGNAGFGGTSTP